MASLAPIEQCLTGKPTYSKINEYINQIAIINQSINQEINILNVNKSINQPINQD